MAESINEFDLDNKKEVGERLEHPESVCLASTTFMKTWKREGGDKTNAEQVRGDLAIESIKMALKKGYRVVIVDGGSSEDFVNRLKEISAEVKADAVDENIQIHDLIVEPETDRGYSGSRRQALKRAENLREEGVKAIVMMEIEKTGITENVEKLVRPILDGSADMVVPERGIKINTSKKDPHVKEEEEDFRGYPPYQAYSETWANKILDKLLVSAHLKNAKDPVLDLFGGTRVIKNDPEILEDFYQKHTVVSGETKTNPKMYFDAAYAPIAYLLAKKRRIVSVPIEYQHPAEQTATEIDVANFDEKRDSQRNMITSEMAKQTRYLSELMRMMDIWMRRFPHELRAPGFGIEGVSDIANGEKIAEFLAEKPDKNSSFEMLKLVRSEGKIGEGLIEYEGRAIIEALLDQKIRLCGLNRKDIEIDQVIDKEIKDFTGSENSIFIIRKSMSGVDLSIESLEVCSWGRFYFDHNEWILAIDEGNELDAAALMVNDILEDYQIKINVKVIPQRDLNSEKTQGGGFLKGIFRR